jgi:hypothetical protein
MDSSTRTFIELEDQHGSGDELHQKSNETDSLATQNSGGQLIVANFNMSMLVITRVYCTVFTLPTHSLFPFGFSKPQELLSFGLGNAVQGANVIRRNHHNGLQV